MSANLPPDPHEDRPDMTEEEAAAIVRLFHDELVRGWIPKRADLEAALDQVRRQ